MTTSRPFIIFDFDNCLAPGNAVGENLLAPLFDELERLEKHHLSGEQFSAMKFDFWRKPLDKIASAYSFSEEAEQRSFDFFRQLELTGSMPGYEDTLFVNEMAGTKILVTSGFEKFQRSKIKGLGVEAAFSDMYFDDPGEPPRQGKGHYFALACDKYGVDPKDVWVIGDSAESEIAAGNALGMKTVQILRAGVERHVSADYHVTGLHEFAKLAGA